MVSDIRHRSCLAWFVPRDVARSRGGAGDGFCSAARPSPSASAVPADYVVQAGDTLQSIARKLYGSSDLWRGLLQPQRIVK
jgi:nucleoid-associated protein YgaU